jgi:hypothetical protein
LRNDFAYPCAALLFCLTGLVYSTLGIMPSVRYSKYQDVSNTDKLIQLALFG